MIESGEGLLLLYPGNFPHALDAFHELRKFEYFPDAQRSNTYNFRSIRQQRHHNRKHDQTCPRVRERLLFFQMALVVFELVRRILGNRERVILSGRVVQVDPRREVAGRKKMLEKGTSR